MAKNKQAKNNFQVKINFSNEVAAKHFLLWLCEAGEQDYFEWMTYREEEEPDGDITALEFDYFATSKKEFAKDLEITVECGRMDNAWKKTDSD